MKKGSITAFLSLVLVLLFSFLLTTLEAARIQGATAYVTMLSKLAGDSFLASYYYPLFQNYRLFGADAGDDNGYFSESIIIEKIDHNFSYGTAGVKGGLLSFNGSEVELENYKTLLSNEGEDFFTQVRQQVILDGLSLTLEELFSAEQFKEAGVVGEVYREQEEALAATATVTEELLKLMELVDGVCMDKDGIVFDSDGIIQTKEYFIKQLAPMEQSEIKALYDAEEVFRATSADFFRADRGAARIELLISDAYRMEADISWLDSRICEYQSRLEELRTEWVAEKKRLKKEKKPDVTKLLELEKKMEELELVMEEEQKSRESYVVQREIKISEIRTRYKELKKILDAEEKLIDDALKILDKIENKQKIARITVDAYEDFLDRMKASLSEELFQVFNNELERMRIYAGLDERGFSVETMRHSLTTDKAILKAIALEGFSEYRLDKVNIEMQAIKRQMKEYSVEGLWYSYGDIVVVKQPVANVTEFLGNFLTAGILSLVGLEKEEQSNRRLSGEALPSDGLSNTTIVKELLDCIEGVQRLFREGGMGEVLKTAGNSLLNGTALELYCAKYFHRYGQEAPNSKLNYEREYIIFGDKEDNSNLFSIVLWLVAIRTLFCMVMILKQPERMAQLDTLSVGVTGFTGMPVLAAVVKYSVLLLWSVEEALVEVSALLQGKRVAVIGTGMVSYGELFLINKEAIEKKSNYFSDDTGVAYQDYLTLISLTKDVKEKAYRTMDLIQENIRFRYNDNFRVRNVVTELSFRTKTNLNKWFDTGMFLQDVYKVECEEAVAY